MSTLPNMIIEILLTGMFLHFASTRALVSIFESSCTTMFSVSLVRMLILRQLRAALFAADGLTKYGNTEIFATCNTDGNHVINALAEVKKPFLVLLSPDVFKAIENVTWLNNMSTHISVGFYSVV